MRPVPGFVHVEQPVRVPPLAGGRDPVRAPVAIAGGGPVGLALALSLATWGVRSVVLEADTTVCTGSRAICLSRRSLEGLRPGGAADAMLAQGLAWTGGRTFHRTDEILRFAMPHDAMQALPPMVNLQQYRIEQALVDAAARFPALIDLRWGTELESFEAHDDGVELRARCDDARYALSADRLVACDGGQSPVRRAMGLKLEGTAFDGKYVIADIVLPSRHPTERRAWFDPPSNPGSTVLMHRQPDDLWRIDYQIPDDADLDEALREENVAAFVRRHLEMIGEAHLPWEIVWISAYRAGAMTLERYRHGRVLFAGNAAHAMPIFGVRGLNSGFEDAANLGWKLAAVARGWAGDGLLDTYDAERRHAFEVNAAAAIKSTEFMAPPSRGFALMREAAVTLAARHRGIAELANPRQTTAIGYPDSPLNATPPAGDGPRPGDPPAQAPVRGPAGPECLTACVGPWWTVLVFDPERAPGGPRATDALAALDAAPWPLRVVEVVAGGEPSDAGSRRRRVDDLEPDGRPRPAARRWGAVAGTTVLLRPDGHVAGRWDAPDAAAVRAAIALAGGGPAMPTPGVLARRADGCAPPAGARPATPPGKAAPDAAAPAPDAVPALPAEARDALYRELALAVTEAGRERESLFLARLALLLLERTGDEAAGREAIAEALRGLSDPSLAR